MEDAFRIRCECGLKVLVPVSAVGKNAKCKGCGYRFVIPPPPPASEAEPGGRLPVVSVAQGPIEL